MKKRAPRVHRWQTCHVLEQSEQTRSLWQFSRAGREVKLVLARTFGVAEALPPSAAGRTLATLWRPRLNVAWLPSDEVFLRALELPTADPAEAPGIVELQLETLSPLPVANIVWTVESVPGPDQASQTVVVIIVPRATVERYLGVLEQSRYLADRLELPQVRELLARPDRRDGAWLFARAQDGHVSCLAAWWQDQRLRHVTLLRVPAGEALAARLRRPILQLAWAGEVEGWHTPETRWHLVAAGPLLEPLTAAVGELAADRVEVLAPLPPEKLAAATAETDSTANLVPAEVAARYRQQFTEGVVLRVLGLFLAVWAVAVFGFMGGLQYKGFVKSGVDRQIQALHQSYTNALQLKARVQVLSDQVSLKFAALDCWRAAAEALPAEMTMTQFNFQGKARRLQIFGNVPGELQAKVTEYNEALARATVNGETLFAKVNTKSIQAQPNRPAFWSIECELKRKEL
jgi:hypothetical protein